MIKSTITTTKNTFSKIALENPEYIQSRIISFIIYQKDRIEKKEIAANI